jgi:hypothetical protein
MGMINKKVTSEINAATRIAFIKDDIYSPPTAFGPSK